MIINHSHVARSDGHFLLELSETFNTTGHFLLNTFFFLLASYKTLSPGSHPTSPASLSLPATFVGHSFSDWCLIFGVAKGSILDVYSELFPKVSLSSNTIP